MDWKESKLLQLKMREAGLVRVDRQFFFRIQILRMVKSIIGRVLISKKLIGLESESVRLNGYWIMDDGQPTRLAKISQDQRK